MKNFAKSVLNYFAAFNETRFRFSSKLSYEWSDDCFTLDFSVFPAFEKQLLDSIALGAPFRFEIRKGDHVVTLKSDDFKKALLARFESDLDEAFLETCIDKHRVQLKESFPDLGERELEEKASAEGLREFNLTFRKTALDTLIDLQDKKVKTLRAEYGITHIPISSFNPNREVQRLFDEFQKIAISSPAPKDYLDAIVTFIESQDFGYFIFDLHALLRRYLTIVGIHSLYVFFHEIARDTRKYPLFTVEVDVQDGEAAIVMESARKVVMLNTPAINTFEFDTVLTTPRAAKMEDAAGELQYIERFLQAKYDVSDRFILSSHFRPLLRDGLPTLTFRAGLQATKDEDRRILDYSELITSLDTGAGRKFIDMVTGYVDGNVESTADETQKAYEERYPRKSTERLAPSRLSIPMSLNETQKKILTAVENPKNEIIVVDGPPGTGKSYAITAIVYLANQLSKSVVITSHKKQALDVIDNSLTERFRTLHPRSKPSILRLEKAGAATTMNNIDNSLSDPVINGARTRSQEANREAVSLDRSRLYEEIDERNKAFWNGVSGYGDTIDKAFRLTQEWEALFGDAPRDDVEPRRLPPGASLDIDRVKELIGLFRENPVTVSLEGLVTLSRGRAKLPSILEQCDELNRAVSSLPPSAIEDISSVPDDLEDFETCIMRLAFCIEPDMPMGKLSLNNVALAAPREISSGLADSYANLLELKGLMENLTAVEAKLLGRFLKNKVITQLRKQIVAGWPKAAAVLEREGSNGLLNAVSETVAYVQSAHSQHPELTKDYILHGFRDCSPEVLKAALEELSSLRFAGHTALVAQLTGKAFSEITVSQAAAAIGTLKTLQHVLTLRDGIKFFADLIGIPLTDLSRLYGELKKVQEFLSKVDEQSLTTLSVLFQHYPVMLKEMGTEANDVSSLGRLADNPARLTHLINYLQLHGELSARPLPEPPARDLLNDYYLKSQKILENDTDRRFSALVNHAADVQRIQTAIAAGKRISREQADVLLNCLSCVISEPGLISQYFPMEADMIDLLIIDEASQVSIAESISLMLRAKQTVVFGDELQYGAVGAVNVSEKYSQNYFKDILRDYAIDRNQAISEEEKERIAREATQEVSEEEETSSVFIPMTPGTKEWLKTFSIRTSTLAFAKALRNYSESLNVHFRSFPEIISYSNEVFYKESQIELVPNRIRTKPIGEVLRFLKVETKGLTGRGVNLDEIEAIQNDIKAVIANGYKGTIGVICSFQEQVSRMEEIFRREMAIHPDLVRNHRFAIWFVGDVQGEERDTIYYSFVEDKKINNGSLRDIYPVIGGTADNIRRLKMQRLNVGFSRAKDVMVFVHSMDIGDFSDTRLGDALRHYDSIRNTAHDHYISDESIFESPAEKELYTAILQTRFFQENREKLSLIAQFEIGKYIREEYHRNIPLYRVDFLLTRSDAGKEKSLVLEYDGVEFHTRNPDIVTRHNFEQEYLEYDIERQLELESYGYRFLRINKYTLFPTEQLPTRIDVLNHLLEKSFAYR